MRPEFAFYKPSQSLNAQNFQRIVCIPHPSGQGPNEQNFRRIPFIWFRKKIKKVITFFPNLCEWFSDFILLLLPSPPPLLLLCSILLLHPLPHLLLHPPRAPVLYSSSASALLYCPGLASLWSPPTFIACCIVLSLPVSGAPLLL